MGLKQRLISWKNFNILIENEIYFDMYQCHTHISHITTHNHDAHIALSTMM